MGFPTLGITSPYTRNAYVHRAQEALTHNKYGNFLGKAKLDNIYGTLTAAATYRAKWYLGYSKARCNNSYGATLHAYLTGEAKPSLVMNWRRKRRLAAAKQNKGQQLRAAIIKESAKYVGIKENPQGSNNVVFSRWYGMIGPWCAMFCSYVMWKIGRSWWRYSYVPTVLANATTPQHSKYRMYEIHPADAEPGDFFCADWNKDRVYDHMGIVRGKIRNGKFLTREGNTGPINKSNGGMVMDAERDITDANFRFIRLVA